MNRSVIIGALVVVLAAGGYYQFSYKPAQEAAAKLATETEATAKAAEEEAAKAAEAAAAAATEAAAATTEAATDAAAATTEAVEGAVDAATEAATDATAAATDAAAAAAAALDPANFNADAITALIDGSALDDTMKGNLKTAVEAAKSNPALVAGAIEQVKAALGM